MAKIKLAEIFPFFETAPSELQDDFENAAILQSISKGNYLAMEGDMCSYFPIVLSGQIRVFKIGDRGQEMTLYRINKGESCVLTIACLLSKKTFPALAFVEEDTELVLVPAEYFREWTKKYQIWNNFIYEYFSDVLSKVITLLEDVTFKRTDLRIVEKIVKDSILYGSKIKTTHQQIARDLGTAREVVSRFLKELEHQKLIKLSRGMIEVINPDGLKNLLLELQ